jgi:hypothetical protein
MNRQRVFWCLLLLVVAGGWLTAAASLRIVPLVRDESVIVSVELTDAYTPEVRDAITSGLRTTFTYDVELRMIVPVWVDRTIASKVVTLVDHYDTLTRRHNLLRLVDGRVEGSLVTEDEALAKKWLTTISAVPIAATSTLDPNREYYVRISAQVRPPGSSLLGLANAVTSQAKFTFIP